MLVKLLITQAEKLAKYDKYFSSKNSFTRSKLY